MQENNKQNFQNSDIIRKRFRYTPHPAIASTTASPISYTALSSLSTIFFQFFLQYLLKVISLHSISRRRVAHISHWANLAESVPQAAREPYMEKAYITRFVLDSLKA